MSQTPSRKPGRNDTCPCGSGRKYKRCCLLRHEAGAATPELEGQVLDRLLADAEAVVGHLQTLRQMCEPGGLLGGLRFDGVAFRRAVARHLPAVEHATPVADERPWERLLARCAPDLVVPAWLDTAEDHLSAAFVQATGPAEQQALLLARTTLRRGKSDDPEVGPPPLVVALFPVQLDALLRADAALDAVAASGDGLGDRLGALLVSSPEARSALEDTAEQHRQAAIDDVLGGDPPPFLSLDAYVIIWSIVGPYVASEEPAEVEAAIQALDRVVGQTGVLVETQARVAAARDASQGPARTRWAALWISLELTPAFVLAVWATNPRTVPVLGHETERAAWAARGTPDAVASRGPWLAHLGGAAGMARVAAVEAAFARID